MTLACVEPTEKLTNTPRLASTWLFGRDGLELLTCLPQPPRFMASWKVPGAEIAVKHHLTWHHGEGFVGCFVCDSISLCLELKILLPQFTKW